MGDDRAEHQPWPMRALLLLGVGAAFGLFFDLLVQENGAGGYSWNWTDDPLRLSLATLVAISGLLFAFTLERVRWTWSVAFALVGGAVLALIFYLNGTPGQQSADDFWQFVSGLLAVAIAAPLFQTMRDRGRRELPYPVVHAHSWTNVVLWFAAWIFVLITWLLAQLLAALFHLIGIDLLKDALRESWVTWMLICGALGAAVGLLRDRDRVLGLLQRVVTTILSVLAPILAIGLVLFVLALPFTGLAPLWEQTRATTPILLGCVIGAIILANAVIGNSPDEEAKAPPLRWSAMALAAVMLPLVIVAAISTGLRIGQHGFTPSRLWAAVFILIAGAYAALYLVALVLGRRDWTGRIRRFNILLALGVCAVALLLATPLLNFGAISARDQLARLEAGRIAADRFDWRAMRFDYGPAGRRALERLKARSGNAEVRRLATAALASERRYDIELPAPAERRREGWRNVRVVPAGTSVPADLQRMVADGYYYQCTGDQPCVLHYAPDADVALLVVPSRNCPPLGADGSEEATPPPSWRDCEPEVTFFYRSGELWQRSRPAIADAAARRARRQRIEEGLRQGRVEVRTVPRRQLFIDGEPAGDPFE